MTIETGTDGASATERGEEPPDEPTADTERGEQSPDDPTGASDARGEQPPDEPTDPGYHAARAALYGAVGAAFHYPDESLLGDLADDEVRAAVEGAAARLGLGDTARRFLATVADADLEALRAEYTELFGLAEGGTYPVVPYEAHYTTGGEVSDEQRRIATVVGLLEEFGVRPAGSFDERRDHVAVELELMQVVAAQRATARYRGDDGAAETLEAAEAAVLDRHLVGFVPALDHELRATTDDDVYLAAGELAAALVELDHATHRDARTGASEVSDDD